MAIFRDRDPSGKQVLQYRALRTWGGLNCSVWLTLTLLIRKRHQQGIHCCRNSRLHGGNGICTAFRRFAKHTRVSRSPGFSIWLSIKDLRALTRDGMRSADENRSRFLALESAMAARFVHFMTAVAVLWHTVVGCCAHHAHADEPVRHISPPAAKRSLNGSHCCGCHHRKCSKPSALEHADSTDESCPCDHSGPCNDPKCAFDTVRPVDVPALNLDAGPVTFPFEVLLASDSVHGARFDEVWPRFSWPPSLRAHLFFGVLQN